LRNTADNTGDDPIVENRAEAEKDRAETEKIRAEQNFATARAEQRTAGEHCRLIVAFLFEVFFTSSVDLLLTYSAFAAVDGKNRGDKDAVGTYIGPSRRQSTLES
jgi:hypothetical protein